MESNDDDTRKDFGELPPEIFQQILGNLSMLDRVRCTGVNKNWRQQCETSIAANPGQINFLDRDWSKIPENQLAPMMAKCAMNLVTAGFDGGRNHTMDRMVATESTFANFEYPKLESLCVNPARRLGKRNRLGSNVIKMINQCPSLKTLEIKCLNERSVDLSKIRSSCKSLQKIDLCRFEATAESFVWFADCTNLTYFKCDVQNPLAYYQCTEIDDALRGFFRSCRQLIHVDLCGALWNVSELLLRDVPEFWTLPKLTEINIGVLMKDEFLAKLVQSYPLVQKLGIASLNGLTNAGIMFLAELTELRRLKIYLVNTCIAAGISAIAANGKLTKFAASGCNLDNWACVLQIIRRSPELSKLTVKCSKPAEVPTDLMCIDLIDAINESLRSFDRPLHLDVESDGSLESVEVRAAAMALKNQNHGHRISGRIGKEVKFP